MQVVASSYEHYDESGVSTYSLAKVTLDNGDHLVIRGDGTVALYNKAGELVNTVTNLYPEVQPENKKAIAP